MNDRKNPLLEDWTTPFEAPPFSAFKPEHYPPAFEAGIAEHLAEVATIAGNPQPATFANTIGALELAGRRLDRVASVFYNLAGSNTNEDLQKIERDIAPVMARHGNEIVLNE
jgi:peptidyl-dipeptidase Dcp